jgi:hypothetical protein
MARVATLIYAGSVGFGGLFLILAFFVSKAPVACTVTGLVLFVGKMAALAALHPLTLFNCLIVFKILGVVLLVQGIMIALSYSRGLRDDEPPVPAATDDV